MTNIRASSGTRSNPDGPLSAANQPITNDPATLISNVPHGKATPNRDATNVANQARATLPSAPPIATHNKVTANPLPLGWP